MSQAPSDTGDLFLSAIGDDLGDGLAVEWPDGSGNPEFTHPPREIEYSWKVEQFLAIPEVRRAEQIVRNYLIVPKEND